MSLLLSLTTKHKTVTRLTHLPRWEDYFGERKQRVFWKEKERFQSQSNSFTVWKWSKVKHQFISRRFENIFLQVVPVTFTFLHWNQKDQEKDKRLLHDIRGLQKRISEKKAVVALSLGKCSKSTLWLPRMTTQSFFSNERATVRPSIGSRAVVLMRCSKVFRYKWVK